MLVSFCKKQCSLSLEMLSSIISVSPFSADSTSFDLNCILFKSQIIYLCLYLRYENSSMSDEKISELVTETLAAVGLKVRVYFKLLLLISDPSYPSNLKIFALLGIIRSTIYNV